MLELRIRAFLLCGKQVAPITHEEAAWRANTVFMSCFLCVWEEEKREEEKKRRENPMMCCDGRSEINLCLIDQWSRGPLLAAPLRRASSCVVVLEQREEAPTCSGIWLQTLSDRLTATAGSGMNTHTAAVCMCARFGYFRAIRITAGGGKDAYYVEKKHADYDLQLC